MKVFVLDRICILTYRMTSILGRLKRQCQSIPYPRLKTMAINVANEDTKNVEHRPLLLLVEHENEESCWLPEEKLRRPLTSIGQKSTHRQRRKNPFITMLDNSPINSNHSFPSQSSTAMSSSRQQLQGRTGMNSKLSDLDALHRMALQNQAACKSIDPVVLNERKLVDKQFASQYQALQGCVRSAGLLH
jgi:hypothetical protein